MRGEILQQSNNKFSIEEEYLNNPLKAVAEERKYAEKFKRSGGLKRLIRRLSKKKLPPLSQSISRINSNRTSALETSFYNRSRQESPAFIESSSLTIQI